MQAVFDFNCCKYSIRPLKSCLCFGYVRKTNWGFQVLDDMNMNRIIDLFHLNKQIKHNCLCWNPRLSSQKQNICQPMWAVCKFVIIKKKSHDWNKHPVWGKNTQWLLSELSQVILRTHSGDEAFKGTCQFCDLPLSWVPDKKIPFFRLCSVSFLK